MVVKSMELPSKFQMPMADPAEDTLHLVEMTIELQTVETEIADPTAVTMTEDLQEGMTTAEMTGTEIEGMTDPATEDAPDLALAAHLLALTLDAIVRLLQDQGMTGIVTRHLLLCSSC